MGADSSIANELDETALQMAARRGHLDIVKELTKTEVDVNTKDTEGWSPLTKAVYNGHVGVVKYLIGKGFDLNKPQVFVDSQLKHEYTTSVLRVGVSSDSPEMVRAIIDADPNVTDKYVLDQTTLQHTNRKVIQILLDNGVTFCDGAMNVAIELASFELLRLLQLYKALGPDTNIDPESGLVDLVVKGNKEVTKVLYQMYFNKISSDTALQLLVIAIQFSHYSIVKLLLSYGINPNQKMLSLEKYKSIKTIPDGGIPDSMFESNSTILHFAAYQGSPAIVDALLKAGADIKATNDHGYSTYHYANRDYKRNEVLTKLLNKHKGVEKI
eukprot:GHVR01041453.1.p1 GENE.GHVR01041453.1~~GHVR01041453.1.p1  ORF type:complete len:327 (+),score=38.55 GHVR01041453.1:259-1239(+)